MSTAFRPLGQFNQYFLNDGTVNAGGSITFYETDLTTLKNTYSDEALTTVNPNPVPLDGSGRLSVDVWGSDAYGAVLADALGATIETRNNIQSDAPTGTTIPALVSGDFLTNDGSVLLWQSLLQIPDPTGSAGDVLATDGTLVFWDTPAAAPTIPAGGITQTTSQIVIGAVSLQWGTGTLPASGGNTTNVSVTFGTAFSGAPYHIELCANAGSGVTGSGGVLILSAASRTATGFNAWGDTNAGFTAGSHPITATTPFTWFAIGPK